MKIASFALCSIFVAIATVVPVKAQTVIDFNSNPGGNPSTYTVSGVTFSTVTAAATLGFPTTPNTTPGLLGSSSSGSLSELRADFLSTLTGTVSVDLGDYNADPDLLFLELFDAGSASLGFTSLATLDSDVTMHTLTLSGANIAFAVFGSRAPSISGSSVFADNFTFINGAVPEPATWAMMLLGFGAIGVSIRRRRPAQELSQAA